jgi:hypothetical protein
MRNESHPHGSLRYSRGARPFPLDARMGAHRELDALIAKLKSEATAGEDQGIARA